MYYENGDTTTAQTIATIESMCGSIYSQYLYKYPGVVGIMSAQKIKGEKYQGIPSITFLVEKKIPQETLPPEQRLPPTINNILTDVVEVGKIAAQSLNYFNENISKFSNSNFNNFYDNNRSNSYNSFNNNKNYTAYANLAIGGIGIGSVGAKTTGTLGCAVMDDNNIYILSSNHVLSSDDNLPENNPIYKVVKNTTSSNQSDFIGSLINSTDIAFAGSSPVAPENRIDAAIAMVGNLGSKDDIYYRILQKGISGLGDITGTTTAQLEDTVYKTGAATGYNSGTVWGTKATVIVDYGDGKTALYTNQIITSSMSKQGDSGSLGWNSQGKVFGLLFAGTDKISVFNPIEDVLTTLKVNLIM